MSRRDRSIARDLRLPRDRRRAPISNVWAVESAFPAPIPPETLLPASAARIPDAE